MRSSLAALLAPVMDTPAPAPLAKRARQARRAATELAAGVARRVARRVERRLGRWVEPATALVRRHVAAEPAPPVEIEVRPTPPSRARVEAWIGAVTRDAGCRTGGEHLGCEAARRLGELADPPPEVLAVLEDAVVRGGRAPCVAAAAVDALAGLADPGARAALERMRAVTRRRAEWEGGGAERALHARLQAALAG